MAVLDAHSPHPGEIAEIMAKPERCPCSECSQCLHRTSMDALRAENSKLKLQLQSMADQRKSGAEVGAKATAERIATWLLGTAKGFDSGSEREFVIAELYRRVRQGEWKR